MSYNEIALQKASKHHKSELAAKDAEIAALREALEEVVDCCRAANNIGGVSHSKMAHIVEAMDIANKALEATK